MSFWVSSFATSFLASSITAILGRINDRRKCRPFIDIQLVDRKELKEVDDTEINIAELVQCSENSKIDKDYFQEPYYLKIKNLSNFICYEIKCKITLHKCFGEEKNKILVCDLPKLAKDDVVYVNVLNAVIADEENDIRCLVNKLKKNLSYEDLFDFIYPEPVNGDDSLQIYKVIHEVSKSNGDNTKIALKPVINSPNTYKIEKIDFNFYSEQFEKLHYKFSPYDKNNVRMGSLGWKNRGYISNLFGK